MDQEALIELIPRLRRYARALTGERFRADDLVQDTLERALAKWALWRPGTDLRAWTFTIMHNVFVNQVRRAALAPESLEPDAGMDLEDRSARADTLAQLNALNGALQRLPDEQREVLLLVTLEGFSYDETAHTLRNRAYPGPADRHRDVAPGARPRPSRRAAGGRRHAGGNPGTVEGRQMSFSESDIHRLVDGELPPARAAEVAAWVAADPVRVRLAEAYRQQRELLHQRYDALLREPVPAAMLETARSSPRRGAAANLAVLRRVAGIALLAVACAAGGWFGHARFAGVAPLTAGDTMADLPERAAVAYAVYSPEVRHPVEVSASDEAHLVGWLSNRLATPVRAPVLGPQGFQLVGGRLLPGEDRPVAQFMYQNAAGKRLTLYLSTLTPGAAAPRESAFRFERVRNVNNFYWAEDNRAYALSGDIGREELMPVARAVYEQLGKSAAARPAPK
jgi:RNA polymerase sigma factor (sigma-70 family)